MIEPRRKRSTRRRGSDRKQRIAILAMVAGLIGCLVLVGREVVSGAPPPPATQAATAAPTLAGMQKAPEGAEIYTGSILFMPQNGKACRQYLFDNVTGQLNDNGMVDCERAAYHPAIGPPKKFSAARVNVISSGFREH